MRAVVPKIEVEGRERGGSSWGGAASRPLKGFHYPRMSSPHTIILLIMDHKKKLKNFLTPFNLESIIVHLAMLYDVF